jgi:hypothetical protein
MPTDKSIVLLRSDTAGTFVAAEKELLSPHRSRTRWASLAHLRALIGGCSSYVPGGQMTSTPTSRWEPRLRYRSNALLRRIERRIMGALFFGAALSMATSAALDQGTEGTPEQRQACSPDAVKLCSAFFPDPDRVKGCLVQHVAALSLPCRDVFEKVRGSTSRSASRSSHNRVRIKTRSSPINNQVGSARD